jgi:hypothetical protein
MIYLRHPTHGTKIATMDLEAEADERNGWSRFDPAKPAVVDTPVNELETRRRRRQPEPQIAEEK